MDKTKRQLPSTAYTKKQAEVYDEIRFLTKGGKVIHETELNILKFALRQLNKSTCILEVGCGTGRIIEEVLKLGYHVNGIDASPNMLDKLNQKLNKLGYQADIRLAEAGKLPYSDNCYDLVYSIRLLNQTESPHYAFSVIKEMIRVARPGAFVLVEFVNAWRPRIGRNKTETTRLNCSEVTSSGTSRGARVVAIKGAFLFGMGALQGKNEIITNFVSILDRLAARVFPKLCSRVYVLFRKNI